VVEPEQRGASRCPISLVFGRVDVNRDDGLATLDGRLECRLVIDS
jgi:hypothetical protein